MAFNADLADELLHARDRDTARFFAGRGAEIDRFDAAVREAAGSRQALFRIFQGAPGCGKTSLAAHLRRARVAEALFIDLGVEDFADREALAARVRLVASNAAPMWAKVAATGLEALGSRLKVAAAAEAAQGALTDRMIGKATLVLHMDEAQTIDETARNVLVGLHTRGMGVPTVCLFTGLSLTEARIRSLDGLSRLASNATINMGRMSDPECADSTRMMLGVLAPNGTRAEEAACAQLAAKLSFGWPQHLFCAQQALTRELARVQGVIADIDRNRVQAEAARERETYYRRQVAGTILDQPRWITGKVVARAVDERPVSQFELARLCRSEIERSGLDGDPDFCATPGEFADKLIEKGVLAFAPDGRLDVPIPSMATWLGVESTG